MDPLLPLSFELIPGPRTSFGRGAIGKLDRRVKGLGIHRVLLVTDAGLVAAGVAARVQGVLEAGGLPTTLFDGVTSNPDVPTVEAGAAALRALGEGSGVVALGGGSPLDAAKGIALIAPNQGAVTDFAFGCRPAQPARPIVAVPTTAGTGAETNMFAVITDPARGRKVLIAHASTMPAAAVLDPELTVGVPARVTGQCGMDVLTHAIEAYTASRRNPVSDVLALDAIRRVGVHLVAAHADGGDLEARASLLLAAHLAGLAFGGSGLGLCHAMGHPLSARYHAPHGQTLATLLPHVMRFNLPAVVERYAAVGEALGVVGAGRGEEGARAAIAAVEALSARVGTALPVGELGFREADLATLVDDALADPLMVTTPRMPGADDVRALYQAAR